MPGFFGEHGDFEYILPGEQGYSIAREVDVLGADKYFCTEFEAINAGYKHKES